MFATKRRDLYKLANFVPLSAISKDEWISWATGHFRSLKVELPTAFVGQPVRRYDAHPIFLQPISAILWNAVRSNPSASP